MRLTLAPWAVTFLLFINESFYFVCGLYTAASSVQVLNNQQFSSKIKNGNDIWLVEFFAPWCGHCKAFASDYEKVAQALKGIIKVAAVEDEAAVASEGVQGFPTVRLYFGKSESPATKDYTGQRTKESVLKFVIQELSSLAQRRLTKNPSAGSKGKKASPTSDQVTELTEANFKNIVMNDSAHVWFVKFYAPWCGHCKALESTWSQLPKALRGKVMVGRLDATAYPSLAQEFGVKGYPTLKMLPAGKKTPDSAITYTGPRELDSLVDFAVKFSASAVEASQLLTNTQFATECEKKLCVIAFLPHLLDSRASGRKKYLDEYTKALRSVASMPVEFFWVQGGDNLELEETLQLQFGYPAIIAIHKEKKKYSVHKGHFTTQSIRSFLSGLMTGQQALTTLPSSLPPFSEAEKWDGMDAKDTTERMRAEEL